MLLTVNDMEIIIRLLENRLNADFDPDCAELLERIKNEIGRNNGNN